MTFIAKHLKPILIIVLSALLLTSSMAYAASTSINALSTSSNTSSTQSNQMSQQNTLESRAFGGEEQSASMAFSDIRSHWAYKSIDYVVNQEIFNGTSATSFSPNQTITGNMFATVLARFSGEIDSTENSQISNGTSNLTREQMAVLVYEYIKYSDLDISLSSSKSFSDSLKISSEAKEAVSTVTALGILSGKSDGTFDPKGTTTRAEAATVIYRLSSLVSSSVTSDSFLEELDSNVEKVNGYTDYTEEDYETIKLNGNSISYSGDSSSIDENTITITEVGTYLITGNLNDGMIIVDNQNDENIRIVLSNANISSSEGSPIMIKNAKNTEISIPSGTKSTLTDGSTHQYDKDSTGVIFSADDLLINGSGTLNIKANYKDGISCNDDFAISETNIVIEAVDDGITANDSIILKDCNITLDVTGDGLKTTNGDEAYKGYITISDADLDITSETDSIQAASLLYIIDGDFQIQSGDDALHGETALFIEDGTFEIEKSVEGLEASIIKISGGDFDITSSDDGINAAGGTDNKLTINGGTINLNASGDGIDVNGSGYIKGGTVIVSGPTNNGNAALDYDGVFEVDGGIVMIAGSSGMAQAPSSSSSQYVISNTVGSQSAGTTVKLVDSDGNTIASFTPEKQYQHVIISSPNLEKGENYKLYASSSLIQSFTIENIVSGDTATGIFPQGGKGPRPNGQGVFPGITPPAIKTTNPAVTTK